MYTNGVHKAKPFMKQVGIKQAREQLPDLIDRVEAGEEIIISRQGRAVAQLVAAPKMPKQLPSLSGFRGKVGLLGTPAAQLLRMERDDR
jgi:prevent-host-death family protein